MDDTKSLLKIITFYTNSLFSSVFVSKFSQKSTIKDLWFSKCTLKLWWMSFCVYDRSIKWNFLIFVSVRDFHFQIFFRLTSVWDFRQRINHDTFDDFQWIFCFVLCEISLSRGLFWYEKSFFCRVLWMANYCWIDDDTRF